MSPDRVQCSAGEAGSRALARLRELGACDGEVLVRYSRGTSLRLARGTPREVGTWAEEGLAVLAIRRDGGSALVTGASWEESADVAERAFALAEGSLAGVDLPSHRVRQALHPKTSATASANVNASLNVPLGPQSEDELASALAAVEAAALAADERVVALDAVQARSAVVASYFASLAGAAAHQRHATSLAHASVLVRDGLKVATRAEAWAGSRLGLGEATAFGDRAARSAVVHLVGSGAAPPHLPRILLGPGALAELTFSFGLGLLGVAPVSGPGWERAGAIHPALSLREDSAADTSARVLPIDGAGRPLRTCAIVEHGAWSLPTPGAAPWVRPGLADLPRPAWMRLSWDWRGGEDEASLLRRLERGLAIESLHALSVDVVAGRWTGSASGWWVEDGRRRHAVAGVPVTLGIAQVIHGAIAGGDVQVLAHPSGVIRSIGLVSVLE